MCWKKILSDYFTFSRKDRMGILALISLILLMFLIPFFYGQPKSPSLLKADSTLLIETRPSPGNKVYERISASEHSAVKRGPIAQAPKADYNPNAVPFQFDPNALDEQGWARLGLPTRTIHTIINYRSKGGWFYKKEDIQKIWGLPEGFYQHVEDFILIPQAFTTAASQNTQSRKITYTSIDINKADTTAFIALPGIGSKLANRIVNFRDKLGGFYSIDQIGETYGLPDSTFQKIRKYVQCPEYSLHQLNINTASKDELKAHPYIRWNLANAIVEFRNQHGNFTTLDDLKNIALIDEPTFKKIIPYLSL
ncbi:helix-hairpin-helix domain-containing protein [Chitinophagaceae bacterium LB-8]|uniref:Helix-hairpin-helix domain-containing protein n=1 Tax=Paraflavisolibacter caeni TaxID=2982496 RepID=A0A9X3B8P0_9BACT|nr:helix-hairpin-helix domain-containing protein [Paraflavisolibacter caeni]MCU7550011.1 helix-hairpin-helix domain-containing protein [Paraflavisolibacter caeni]